MGLLCPCPRVSLSRGSRAFSGRATSLTSDSGRLGPLQLRPRLGCGRLRSRQAGWAWVGRGPPSLTGPHPGFSCSHPPFPLQPVISQRVPASLHGHGWASCSRTSPPPAPTGHGPRPARPARSARAPSWRGPGVSGVRVPFRPQAPHHCLNPLPILGPPSTPGISPSLPPRSSRFWSLPAPPFRLHVPLPAAPFLPLPDWSLPPFFLHFAPPSLAAYGG